MQSLYLIYYSFNTPPPPHFSQLQTSDEQSSWVLSNPLFRLFNNLFQSCWISPNLNYEHTLVLSLPVVEGLVAERCTGAPLMQFYNLSELSIRTKKKGGKRATTQRTRSHDGKMGSLPCAKRVLLITSCSSRSGVIMSNYDGCNRFFSVGDFFSAMALVIKFSLLF